MGCSTMRILIDINHPAHVHVYRNTARELERRGHEVTWTATDKNVTLTLMKAYGFEPAVISKYRPGMLNMALAIPARDLRLLSVVRKRKPDVMIGTSVSICHVGRLTRVPSLYFTKASPLVTKLIAKVAFPFADRIVTPDCLPDEVMKPAWRKKWMRYPGYHELCYLHPAVFTPDAEVKKELGVGADERYFIVRLIAWQASHDVGQSGWSLDMTRRVIGALEPHGRVFISPEGRIDPSLEKYRIPIRPDRMHHALAFATMCLGDSGTMPAEAAVLGTPSLRCDTLAKRQPVFEELEKRYGLCLNYDPAEIDAVIAKIGELLAAEDLRGEWQRRRMKMLSEKNNTSQWMADFVEHKTPASTSGPTRRNPS